jgi:hypothetical protein
LLSLDLGCSRGCDLCTVAFGFRLLFGDRVEAERDPPT